MKDALFDILLKCQLSTVNLPFEIVLVATASWEYISPTIRLDRTGTMYE